MKIINYSKNEYSYIYVHIYRDLMITRANKDKETVLGLYNTFQITLYIIFRVKIMLLGIVAYLSIHLGSTLHFV